MRPMLYSLLILFSVGILSSCGLPPGSDPTSQATSATATVPMLQWDVAIVQDDTVVPIQNGEVSLQKAPFTIRVSLPLPMDVMLNAFDQDTNVHIIQPGTRLHTGCPKAFCPAMGLAEPDLNSAKHLTIDQYAIHYLYYHDPEHHRWSRVKTRQDGVVFERDVAFLSLGAGHEAFERRIPVDQFPKQKLYLVFVVDYRETSLVNDDEVRTVVLAFK